VSIWYCSYLNFEPHLGKIGLTIGQVDHDLQEMQGTQGAAWVQRAKRGWISSMIFPATKLAFIGDFPLPRLIARG
jgi:hypothetical protein